MGYIRHDELVLSLTTRGEKLPPAALDQLLLDSRYNRLALESSSGPSVTLPDVVLCCVVWLCLTYNLHLQ